jgi:hypothetical protein
MVRRLRLETTQINHPTTSPDKLDYHALIPPGAALPGLVLSGLTFGTRREVEFTGRFLRPVTYPLVDELRRDRENVDRQSDESPRTPSLHKGILILFPPSQKILGLPEIKRLDG